MEKQIKVLGVATQENADLCKQLLNYPEINCMDIIPPNNEVIERAASFPINAIVVLSEGLTDDEYTFLSGYFLARKDVAAVLVTETIDVDIMTHAMACGINKVIPLTEDFESICVDIVAEAKRFQRREEKASVREYESNVISFFSSKGGAGTSTLIANAASYFKAKGKKVAVVDLNLDFGDLECMLNVPKGDTIAELSEEMVVTPQLVKSYLRTGVNDIPLIAAPATPESGLSVTPEVTMKVLETLRIDNDYVLVDMSTNINESMKAVLRECDKIIFVTVPEIPAAKNAKACIDRFLAKMNVMNRVHLVINKSGKTALGDKDVSDFLGIEEYISIPYDLKTLGESVNSGTPFLNKDTIGKKSGGLMGAFFSSNTITALERLMKKIAEQPRNTSEQ